MLVIHRENLQSCDSSIFTRIHGQIRLTENAFVNAFVSASGDSAVLETAPKARIFVEFGAETSLEESIILSLLNKGIDVLVFQFKRLQHLKTSEILLLFSDIPADRLAIAFAPDASNPSTGPNFALFCKVFGCIFIVDPPAIETIVQLRVAYPDNTWIVDLTTATTCTTSSVKALLDRGMDVCIREDTLYINAKSAPPPKDASVDYVDAVFGHLRSDRADGLFPTLVVDEFGKALGLCYSSKESIAEAIYKKMGVYWSRERGLWHKGLSSGATQQLLSISLDCDSDTLCFTVRQFGPGFCHLNTRTCFGAESGMSALFRLLQSRFVDAPEKSYTARLFADSGLLDAKIREEAQEVRDARDKKDVAWEAADLLYFVFVKAVAAGVGLDEIERNLDMKAKKVTRRPGDAKPAFIQVQQQQEDSVLPSMPSDADVPILPLYHMKIHNYSKISSNEKEKLLLRPIIKTDEIMDRVRPIVSQVRKEGDIALISLTKKFDKVDLESCGGVVLSAPFPESLRTLPATVKAAIDLAYGNIEKFHRAQMESQELVVETMPGVTCTRFCRPIERVGLYVPGGTAVLPSTALMLGIPAKVAGCSQIVIATPPRPDGSIVPEVVYVAHLVGASCIVKAGGAQAVAAMAYGTKSVPKVDKICGPGNQYVTAAKMIAQSDSSALLAIDMPAGPSELLVIADKTADPRYVVSDLLSQAEHGVDSQVVLLAVGLDTADLELYQDELVRQASALPRNDIVKVSLSKSYILVMDTIDEALAFSNKYAPEHLILNIEEAERVVERVMNAGSVFVGPFSPESCGDYASGTNHTLPTYGYARMYSGVNTHTFLKHITSQKLTREGLDSIGDAVVTLAEIEGLDAHRNAVAIRLGDIRASANGNASRR